MRTLHVAVAAASILTAAVAGQSQALVRVPDREPSAEKITTSNVDFRDPAQVRAFYNRLQQAALFVCGVQGAADHARREADRACSEKALREAVNGVDRPLLTAAYQQAGAPMLARGY